MLVELHPQVVLKSCFHWTSRFCLQAPRGTGPEAWPSVDSSSFGVENLGFSSGYVRACVYNIYIWLIVHEIYTRMFHAPMCSVSAHREVLTSPPALVVRQRAQAFG